MVTIEMPGIAESLQMMGEQFRCGNTEVAKQWEEHATRLMREARIASMRGGTSQSTDNLLQNQHPIPERK